jgi:hypothetical protein
MRLAGYVACMGRGYVCTRIWWDSLRERYHLEDLGLDGRLTLKWIEKYEERWTSIGLIRLVIRTVLFP